MARTDKMPALKVISILPSLKWYSKKNGKNHKNGPTSMFRAKNRENRNLSTETLSNLQNPPTH